MKHASFLIPVILITITCVLVACSKSNNGSKPKITLKTITTEIPPQGGLDATFDFTPGSASLSGGTFVAIRIRQNQIPLPPTTVSVDSVMSTIPDFPSVNKGQFEYQEDYNYLHQSDAENDTVIFKFAVLDVAGHSSDTITTGKIVIHIP